MRAKGLTQKEVLAKLKLAAQKDLKYEDGKILRSMCTSPQPIAKIAHQMFLESNLGDPALFPGSAQLEREAVASLTELLHGPREAGGFIVSGGTEANLLAVYAARNASKAKEPEIVAPESAHFSFDKICDMLKIKLVKAKLDAAYRVNPADVARKITKNTIALVGNAGSPELGVVDPLEELSKIAVNRGLPLHVDAAFGGLVIPFLKDLGYDAQKFDFQLDGVQSITVDPHKMGMSTVPAGGILFRDQTRASCIKTEVPYLAEEHQCTFVGTRSGASAVAAWAVFESLGHAGFKGIVKRCMETTAFLCNGLQKAGFEVLVQPTINIVAFRCEDPKGFVEMLQKRGWYVSFVPRLNCTRIIVMPHTTNQNARKFLKCVSKRSAFEELLK